MRSFDSLRIDKWHAYCTLGRELNEKLKTKQKKTQQQQTHVYCSYDEIFDQQKKIHAPKSNKCDAIEQIESHWKTVYEFNFSCVCDGLNKIPVCKFRRLPNWKVRMRAMCMWWLWQSFVQKAPHTFWTFGKSAYKARCMRAVWWAWGTCFSIRNTTKFIMH